MMDQSQSSLLILICGKKYAKIKTHDYKCGCLMANFQRHLRTANNLCMRREQEPNSGYLCALTLVCLCELHVHLKSLRLEIQT